jgi:hypothetical protein
VINLTTKAVPTENFLNISIGGSGDTETTFQNGLTYFGSRWDTFGFDNGNRDIPSNLQSFFDSGQRIEAVSQAEARGIAGQLFPTNLVTLQKNDSLPMNFSGNVTGGPPGQPDPSTGGGSWSTFTAGHMQHHQMQSAAALNGSREPNCCAIVCSVNYLCCSIAWDADCAASALTIPDCYITRDYFADLIDVDTTDEVTTAASANRSIYALNPAFQAAGQPTGVSDFDQGNPYSPTTLATPYYGDSLLLLGETFNPGAGAEGGRIHGGDPRARQARSAKPAAVTRPT